MMTKIDSNFLFASDIHACRTASRLGLYYPKEGKTDENLCRYIFFY